jgi:hypothetical protein
MYTFVILSSPSVQFLDRRTAANWCAVTSHRNSRCPPAPAMTPLQRPLQPAPGATSPPTRQDTYSSPLVSGSTVTARYWSSDGRGARPEERRRVGTPVAPPEGKTGPSRPAPALLLTRRLDGMRRIGVSPDGGSLHPLTRGPRQPTRSPRPSCAAVSSPPLAWSVRRVAHTQMKFRS